MQQSSCLEKDCFLCNGFTDRLFRRVLFQGSEQVVSELIFTDYQQLGKQATRHFINSTYLIPKQYKHWLHSIETWEWYILWAQSHSQSICQKWSINYKILSSKPCVFSYVNSASGGPMRMNNLFCDIFFWWFWKVARKFLLCSYLAMLHNS